MLTMLKLFQCILTGVKGFQFKQRSAFELHVYVDDGSLISEVLIDHNVSTCTYVYNTSYFVFETINLLEF